MATSYDIWKLESDAEGRGTAHDDGSPATKPVSAGRESLMDDLTKQMEKDRDEIVARIAREQLGIADLTARNHDRLDFHEVHVTALRGALESAYFSGRAASAAAIARHLADKAQEGSR